MVASNPLFFIIREMDDINTNRFMCEIVTQYDTQALLSQALGLHIFLWFMLAYSIDHNLVMVFPSKMNMTTISSETKITTSYKNHIHLTTISLIKSSLVTTFFWYTRGCRPGGDHGVHCLVRPLLLR